MNTKHIPWKFGRNSFQIYDTEGRHILDMHLPLVRTPDDEILIRDLANTILRAVNAHDALVEAADKFTKIVLDPPTGGATKTLVLNKVTERYPRMLGLLKAAENDLYHVGALAHENQSPCLKCQIQAFLKECEQ